MADTTTISGLPYPEGSDANNVPSDMADLADALDGTIVKKLTSVEIAGLAAGEKPAGTLVYNSTTGKLQKSNGSTFVDVIDAAGGTMTGNLTISKANPFIYLTATSGSALAIFTRASGEIAGSQFNEPGGAVRWRVYHHTDDDFNIGRYTGSSAYQDTPVSIDNATGNITVTGKISGLDAATTNGDAVRYEQLTAVASYMTAGGGAVADSGTEFTLPAVPAGKSGWAVSVQVLSGSSGRFATASLPAEDKFTAYVYNGSNTLVAGNVLWHAVAY